MKNLTRKQINEFNNEVIEILDYYGASKVNDTTYTMNSNVIGLLTITLDYDISSVYTIYANFKDTDKAVNYFNVKLYNGKMNTHEYTQEPCLTFIDQLLHNYNYINERDSQTNESNEAITVTSNQSSIINFAGEYKTCDKSFDEVVLANAKNDNIHYQVGNQCTINFNGRMKAFADQVEDKEYTVVSLSWSFADNEYYVGLEINGEVRYILQSDLLPIINESTEEAAVTIESNPTQSNVSTVSANTNVSNTTQPINPWTWTALTQSLKPERTAGDTVPLGYLTKGSTEYYPYQSWITKGYVTKTTT